MTRRLPTMGKHATLRTGLAPIVVLTTVLCVHADIPQAWAQTSSASASASPAPTASALLFPKPVSTTLPAPEASAIAELESQLATLAGSDPQAHASAAADLANQDATSLPAISAKLQQLRKQADRDGMAQILSHARRRGRTATESDDDTKSVARAKKRQTDTPPVPETSSLPPNLKQLKPPSSSLATNDHNLLDTSGDDWLAFVLAVPQPDKPAFRDLVSVLALGRICVGIGTTASAREVINIYMYFGDLFRIDVQRLLARMEDRALPALIEAQYHDSNMVRSWAARRLDVLGKAIPSEAVRTDDNQVLADVLRAYGRARDIEALRVIVAFANSERIQVREAAREALGQIGDAARWPLREAYEDLLGKRPEPGWDWRRTALELFAAYDRARTAEVLQLMDQGVRCFAEGKVSEAVTLFDKVLARAPMFDRRQEMVAAYRAYANLLQPKDRLGALAVLRRAHALDPRGTAARSIESQIALFEAQDLADKSVVDLSLFRRATELDPTNAAAADALDRVQRDPETRQASWRRYLAAVLVGVVALFAMLVIALFPRRGRSTATSPDPESDDASPST